MFVRLFSLYKNSKTLGATLIVAGTTVGVGMLAMPLTAAGIGYKSSLVLLFFMWALMYGAALIQIHLFKGHPSGISFATLVERVLGPRYKIIPAIVKNLLFLGLLAAYMTGGASVMVQMFNQSVSNSFGIILFSIIFGFIICLNIKSMDQINRVLVFFKFSFFIFVVYLLTPSIEPSQIARDSCSNLSLLTLSIPAFFTAYGFHGSIPNLITFLNHDEKKLKRSFFYGSLIPMITYVLWLTITFGVLPDEKIQHISTQTSLPVFLDFLSSSSGNPSLIKTGLQWFSFVSFMTSFIGVGMVQVSYVEEILTSKITRFSWLGIRTLSGMITIVVPLCFSLFYPNGFIMAIAFAGFWLCILALILPCIMALKQKDFPKNMKIISFICLFFGLLLFALEFFIKAGCIN